MSKHSPGPWRWEDGWIVDANGHRPMFVDSSSAWEAGDETIGYCVPEDARLIVAAPQMLELLRRLAAGPRSIRDLQDETAALLAEIDG